MSPTQLKFTIGGFNGECHEVEWQQGKLSYRQADGAYMWAVSPSNDAWAVFCRAMETAGVWQWQASYVNPDICDGTQWSLKLKYLEQRVRCEGSNAYPGGTGSDYSPSGDFAHFLKALRSVTGQSAIH